LNLASGELKVIDDLFNLAKVYTIGQGLNLTSGELKIIDDLFNLAKIYNIGQGLQLNSGTLHADVKDVTVDGTSVVNGRIAAIAMPVRVDNGDGAWEVADEYGNVALRITNEGHLLTSQFDSEEVARLVRIYSLGTGLSLDQAGQLSVSITGGVTDVKVDNISVVTDTVANITMPIKMNEGEGAFEISDEAGNVAMQITSEGHIRTKEFDSSNIFPNLDF